MNNYAKIRSADFDADRRCILDTMETRRNAIVELVNENGTVSFSQIKNAFPNVSEMTLRTDLKLLDEAKRIVRIHGGAKSVQVIIGTDDYLSKRSVRNIPAKQKIAAKALSCCARTPLFSWIPEVPRLCLPINSRISPI